MIALQIFSDPVGLAQLENAIENETVAILHTTRPNAKIIFNELENIMSIDLLHLTVETGRGEWHDYIRTSNTEEISLEDTNSLVRHVIKAWQNEGCPKDFHANLYPVTFTERAKIALDWAAEGIKTRLLEVIHQLMEDTTPTATRRSNYDKDIMIMKVDERIRLFYSKTSSHLNIIDIIDRSEYAHD